MTIPASGPASLGMIRDEFGGSNPARMSQYYRGGALVASNASGTISTGGAISVSQFRGVTKPVSSNVNPAFSTTRTYSSVSQSTEYNSFVSILFLTNGQILTSGESLSSPNGGMPSYVSSPGQSVGNNYYVRMRVSYASSSVGPVPNIQGPAQNVWHNLAVAKDWKFENEYNGNTFQTDWTILFDISQNPGNPTDMRTCTVYIALTTYA